MDPKSKERLDKILTKNPDALTEDEIGFIKARRSYLKKIQIEEYESILKPVTSQTSDQETVNTHARKSK